MVRKILIVDDLKPFVEQEKNILMRSDFKIYTANSGKAALELHSTEKMDLILIDLDMPEMNGDELCSIIREEKSSKRVSLIMVCNNRKESLDRVAKCGANSFITKPISAPKLIETVTRYLEVAPRMTFRVLVKATVKGSFKNEPFFGTTSNISVAGILLETEKTLAKGDTISCSFFIPDSDRILIEGEVARVVKKDATTYQYGVKFINIDTASRAAIEKYIEKKTSVPA